MVLDDINLEKTIARLIKIGATAKFLSEFPIFARQMASSSYDLVRVSVINSILKSKAASGLSHKEWKESLDIKGLESLAKSRIRTSYRTSLLNHYNQGTYEESIAADVDLYFIYDAVNDSQTRPYHAAVDGTVRKVTDDFWENHTPPLGFNCRCVLRTLSKERAKRDAERKGKKSIRTTDKEINDRVKAEAIRNNIDEKDVRPKANSAFKPRNPRKPLEFIDQTLKKQIEDLPPGLKAPFKESLRRREAEAKSWYEKNKDKFTKN